MLRQGDAQVFKKYSQMKLQIKRDALEKPNRQAGEIAPAPRNQCARSWSNKCNGPNKCTVNARLKPKTMNRGEQKIGKCFRMSSVSSEGV